MLATATLRRKLAVSGDGGRHWRPITLPKAQPQELIAVDGNNLIAGFTNGRCHGRAPLGEPQTFSVAAEKLRGHQWKFLACVPAG